MFTSDLEALIDHAGVSRTSEKSNFVSCDMFILHQRRILLYPHHRFLWFFLQTIGFLVQKIPQEGLRKKAKIAFYALSVTG